VAIAGSFLVMRKRPRADISVSMAERSMAAVLPELMSCSASRISGRRSISGEGSPGGTWEEAFAPLVAVRGADLGPS
jgi:hypothetical protein